MPKGGSGLIEFYRHQMPFVTLARIAHYPRCRSILGKLIHNFQLCFALKRAVADQHCAVDVHCNCMGVRFLLSGTLEFPNCDWNAQNNSLATAIIFAGCGRYRAVRLGPSIHIF